MLVVVMAQQVMEPHGSALRSLRYTKGEVSRGGHYKSLERGSIRFQKLRPCEVGTGYARTTGSNDVLL